MGRTLSLLFFSRLSLPREEGRKRGERVEEGEKGGFIVLILTA